MSADTSTELGCRTECPYRGACDLATQMLDENLGDRFSKEVKQQRLGELVLLTEVFNKVHMDCEGPVNDGVYCRKAQFVNDTMALITRQSAIPIGIPSFGGEAERKD